MPMTTKMPNRVWIVALAAAVAACDGGPSDSEFQAACLKEGAGGANKALRREMGIDSAAFCECIAKESRSQLTAEGRQAMMLDMQGNAQEARKISMKMSEADQKAFMQGGMAVMQVCMPKAFGK
jgi:hypothetical protein